VVSTLAPIRLTHTNASAENLPAPRQPQETFPSASLKHAINLSLFWHEGRGLLAGAFHCGIPCLHKIEEPPPEEEDRGQIKGPGGPVALHPRHAVQTQSTHNK
jgi:hypothetical protein